MRGESLLTKEINARPSWDDYFMSQAELVASRSSCDRAAVGAVVVLNKTCIATGYNGSVAGLTNCDESGHLLEEGHCVRTVHAEMNALLQCARHGRATDGATIYVTHYPCLNCMKSILQAGIKRIVYLNDYRNNPISAKLASEAGVDVIHKQKETDNVRN